ncbi:EARP and GARP complex-interacting protein 1-like [Antedon mediterranea]|uniref:EARP and GARP complex-interacting protein 1-like n=1 Tax=Antedon mediterranea TaxID=105859 RepID=UPI003AF59BBE
MEDDAPVIYGLEFQARALTAQVAESEAIRFLVGTQSLKFDNQVHLLDFDEENNQLNKTVYLHKEGEIWHIASNPANKDILATCYNKTVDNKTERLTSLWRIPSEDDVLDSGAEDHGDSSSSPPTLELLCNLDSANFGNIVCTMWEPQADGTKMLTLSENNILEWDLQASSSQARISNSATLEVKGHPKFTCGSWNPHHNNVQIATANDTTIRGWDLRTMQEVYTIENAHSQLVRDVDFNPNKQYYLASCGDDCKVQFWDTRNTSESVKTLTDHSHWVWSVRYNHFHDQLVLTSSSDSRVTLNNVSSISSEPFGHHEEDDDDSDIEDSNRKPLEPVQDDIISTYEEHEDSVYAAEWSTADPWLFASLSFDGRLVINRVPRAEKYRILL